jgi:hypothetical protein
MAAQGMPKEVLQNFQRNNLNEKEVTNVGF